MSREVSSGEAFDIFLPSIPSTGYVWYMEDDPLVELLREDFLPDLPIEQNRGILCGGSGQQLFTLICHYPYYQHDLHFYRKRIWQKTCDEYMTVHLYVI